MMEANYNTQQEKLILKEYGRNVQKLVRYISTLETQEERTEAAHALIALMRQLNPSVREHNDNIQRIWDHLYVMADFELDIDSPYPVPEPETLQQKPQSLGYKTTEPVFKHYGRNLELLVQKAIEIEDTEEQKMAVIHIVKLMKSFYGSWTKDNIEDSVIVGQLKRLSKGEIQLTAEEIRAELNRQKSRGGHHNQHRNNRRNNNHNHRRK